MSREATQQTVRQEMERGLERFGQLLLAAGEKIGAAIQEQTQPATLAALSQGLHAVARSYRQTCALRLKFDRQAVLDQRQDLDYERQHHVTRIQRRKDRLKSAVRKLVWTEYEKADADAEAEDLDVRLDHLIDDAAVSRYFLTEDPEKQIADLLKRLGLSPPSPSPTAGGGPQGGSGGQPPPIIWT